MPVIDNSAVIETGTIRYVSIKAEMAFNRMERYTTTCTGRIADRRVCRARIDR